MQKTPKLFIQSFVTPPLSKYEKERLAEFKISENLQKTSFFTLDSNKNVRFIYKSLKGYKASNIEIN